MRRSAWLLSLVLLLFALSLSSCQQSPAPPAAPVERAPLNLAAQTTTDEPAAAPDPTNPCPGKSDNPNMPMVCVDDTGFPRLELDPSPETAVHLYTTKTMHWFTKSGAGTIAIVYDSLLVDAP